MAPLKIVIVVEQASPIGGAELVAITSARGLAERGHSVTVLAAHGPSDPSLQNIPNLTVVSAHDGGSSRKENKLARSLDLWIPAMRATMIETLKSMQGQRAVVHFHSGADGWSASALGPLASAGLPLVYTHHDYGWACPIQGFFNYKTLAPCGKQGGSPACLTTLCKGQGKAYSKAWSFARHYLSYRRSGIWSAVNRHIFVSEFNRGHLQTYLPPDSNQRVVRNPILVQDEGPAPISERSRFTYVGRLTIEKDPVTAAHAAKQAGLPITFVGDGQLREEVERANPEAEVTGWIDKAQVHKRIRAARALVFSSRWFEGQPLVVPEALACGVPAIVSSVSAAAGAVANRETGLHFQAGNVNELAAAMTQLNDAAVAEAFGLNAYARFWSDPPTLESHLDAIEQVYSEVVNP